MTITFRAKTVEGWTVESPLQAFTFPAGEVHIKGVEAKTRYAYQVAEVRGFSHDDLFTLAMWSDAVHERGEKAVLVLPYLPGARADRGVPFGAANYAEFIANLEIDQLITLDPHSPVWVEQFNAINLSINESVRERGGPDFTDVEATVFPFERIIKREIQDGSSDSKPQPYVGVIAPDKGAVERASRAARVMGVPVYLAGKTRDFETGKLTGFHMEDELPAEGKLLLVDDICDGGGTFIGLAEAIDLPPERLDLWVTHGIFSKGLRYLAYRFGQVHTTNSFKTREDLFNEHIRDHDVYELTSDPKDGGEFLHIHDITPYMVSAINV